MTEWNTGAHKYMNARSATNVEEFLKCCVVSDALTDVYWDVQEEIIKEIADDVPEVIRFESANVKLKCLKANQSRKKKAVEHARVCGLLKWADDNDYCLKRWLQYAESCGDITIHKSALTLP